MKISNSKKELARIISENGGWRDGYDFASQDGDDYAVWFYDSRPVPGSGRWWKACSRAHRGIEGVGKLPNWHETILSRDEYFHLYPVAEAAPEPVSDAKPTIEQLAADYRNAKDYADRKQQEADEANADADAKLVELVAAGKELGLVPVSAVKPAIDGCMQLVDMVPTRLQSHQEESVAAIGHVVNVERLYDKVRDAFDLLK